MHPVDKMGTDQLFMAPEIGRYVLHISATAAHVYSLATPFDVWLQNDICTNTLVLTSTISILDSMFP